MKQWFLLFAFCCMVVFAACKGQPDEKKALQLKITEAENAFTQKNNTTFDPVSAKNAVDAYEAYTAKLPDAPETPTYLFKAGELYRSLKQFDKAFAAYERILAQYSAYEKAPHSLFLIGFTYENDVKDLDKAKEAYERFLKTYPNHELADDVQFSLGNLGKSPDEIIKAFSEKNAGNNPNTTTNNDAKTNNTTPKDKDN